MDDRFDVEIAKVKADADRYAATVAAESARFAAWAETVQCVVAALVISLTVLITAGLVYAVCTRSEPTPAPAAAPGIEV